jgi:hypothetical protein
MAGSKAGGRLDRETRREGWIIAVGGERIWLWFWTRLGLRVREPAAMIVIPRIEETDPAIIQIIREEIYDCKRTAWMQG